MSSSGIRQPIALPGASALLQTATQVQAAFPICASALRTGRGHRPGGKGGQGKEHELCCTGRILSTVCSPKPQGTSLASLGHKKKVHKPAVLLNRQVPATNHTMQLRLKKLAVQTHTIHSSEHQRASANSKGYCHEKPSKEEHENKVSCPSTEGAFF